jgi:glutamate synthase (NADPH/NADH) small chain
MAKPINNKRVEAREQAAEARKTNFTEVALGYSEPEAREEAARCLLCAKPLCVQGCPVGIDIPGFLGLAAEGRFLDAARLLKQANALPAICGRVCPQETQCEIRCVLGKKGDPVAIGRLERFLADYERERAAQNTADAEAPAAAPASPPPAPSGFQVAVIGSGPAGLTCAGELVKRGHRVVVFEALHKPGGVLVYGIPEFRLPNSIVEYEIEQLRRQGVEIRTDAVIGLTFTLQELFDSGFDAIFIGTGAGLPKFLDIPGENLNGVISANEFLTRINLMEAYRFPDSDTPVYAGERTVVLGAGNTAMDAARSAVRLGATEVTILYRRSRQEMPARKEEIVHAEQEGVRFRFLTAPLRILGNEKGWVRGIESQRMELGEPDESGRRRPVPVPGSEFILECDTVINAVGSGINQLIFRDADALKRTRWGTVVIDEETGATTLPGVFAAGDVAIGAATVILAMGSGKKAARGIHNYLLSKSPRTGN